MTIKPRTITGFKEKPEHPVEEDLRALFHVKKGKPRTNKGDKLAGWPLWEDGPDWGTCPVCNGRMELLLQLESSPKHHLQFGDMGRAWVQVCPAHPSELRFSSSSG